MILNITNKKENCLITLDLSLNEIRMVKDGDKIEFIPLTADDRAGYSYLLENKYYKTLMGCIIIDLDKYGKIKFKLKDLEILEQNNL